MGGLKLLGTLIEDDMIYKDIRVFLKHNWWQVQNYQSLNKPYRYQLKLIQKTCNNLGKKLSLFYKRLILQANKINYLILNNINNRRQ